MQMVAVVAVVRLLIGTVIGLGAGWSAGGLGRWLDTFISAALAVPVLMVALGGIAMLGAELGLLAFIVGLSINGWGETARIVREQTRAIRGQLYIEAAHALGASKLRMLRQHVLRQIMPMVWMLLAFEISSTLMVTAGLGFLGYYIGGDVWIEVADFVSRRVSGTPELGQMLATSWASLTQPWPMVLTGTVIFIAVLGFNLLGEGLRARLDPEKVNRGSLLARFSRAASAWLEETVTYPAGIFLRRYGLRLALAVALVAALGGSLYLWRSQANTPVVTPLPELSIPGGQLWSGELGDPYGSRWVQASGPAEPLVAWSGREPAGYAGGPAVAADGTVYIITADGRLLAYAPDGSPRWQAPLPGGSERAPVGAPALGLDGTVYIADAAAGLAAFGPQGQVQWYFESGEKSPPKRGPLVGPDGAIYLLLEDVRRGDRLLAASPQGELLWAVDTGTKQAGAALRLSPDGKQLFLGNLAFDPADGHLLELVLPSAEDPVLAGREQYLVGGDGLRYVLAGHYVMQWQPSPAGFELLRNAEWNYQEAGMNQNSSYPVDAGVTRDQRIWLLYSGFYGGTRIAWLGLDGEVLGYSAMPLSENSRMLGVDGQGVAYICGPNLREYGQDAVGVSCLAFQQGSAEPLWQMALPQATGEVLGGALLEGRLYVATEDGSLFALGGEPGLQPQAAGGPTGQPASSPAPEQSQPAGPAWAFQVPEDIGGLLRVYEDGTVAILSVENTFYQLNAQGELVRQAKLDPPPYSHPEGRFILEPYLLPDGALLVFSEALVYALDAQGAHGWEVPLAGIPVAPPEEHSGVYYLTDSKGFLYAIGAAGLVWQFNAEGIEKAISGPVLGPDGVAYYTIILNNKAYIQAVGPDGAARWQTPVKTGFFYDPLQINALGTLLFLRDDVYETQNGALLDLQPFFPVNEYVMGEDGLTYVRSGHVVMQWQIGPDGKMLVTHTATWDSHSFGQQPFLTRVSARQVIWLYYGERMVWLTLDGEILNSLEEIQGRLGWWDFANTRLFACDQPIRSAQLDCRMYNADSAAPAWQASYTGLPDTEWGFIFPDALYAVTREDVFYKVEVQLP
jgi:ABC-type dipeptide/oligopeptide/nickel transport system permease subunit